MILEYCEEEAIQNIKIMVEWKLTISKESVLQSLLKHRQDQIAAEFCHNYAEHEDSGEVLFKYAVNNANEYFLKYALKNSFF